MKLKVFILAYPRPEIHLTTYFKRAFKQLGHEVIINDKLPRQIDLWFLGERRTRIPANPFNIPVAGVIGEEEPLGRQRERTKEASSVWFSLHSSLSDYTDKKFGGEIFWACDEELHPATVYGNEDFDIAYYGRRRGVANQLSKRDNFYYAGYFTVPHEELSTKVFNRTKTTLSVTLKGGAQARLFECLASGKMVFSDVVGDYKQQFWRDGEHLVRYKNLEDLRVKLSYYLENEKERLKIGKAGQLDVLKKHTYTMRVKYILKEMGQRGLL